MKLQNLKPRVAAMKASRIQSLAVNPAATPRLRGRAGMERRAKWLAEHPLCVCCEAKGITRMAEVVDHVTPLWKGGADNESNFQSLCQKPCHEQKTAREASERAGRQRKAGGVGEFLY